MTCQYQMLKRILTFCKQYNADLNGAVVNGMIADACQEALDDMDYKQQMVIKAHKASLQKNIHNMGDKGALELLAAISFYVGGGR